MRTVASERFRDIAEIVLKDAAQKGLPAGGRLPTERELAEGLQLSRSTVRSAMALLEAEGAVSREVGRGTYLRRDPQSPVVDLDWDVIQPYAVLKDVGPADVMAARQLLEPAAMYSVVAQATEADFDEVDRCLIGCENAADYDEFEMWDLSFHRSLVLGSHNALLVRMYLLIEVARKGALWGSLKRRSDSSDRREHYCDQHRAIVTALRSRDARGAHDAMAVHLDAVEASLRMGARSR